MTQQLDPRAFEHSDKSCIHPRCKHQVTRGRFACSRHYYQIDADLRRQLEKAYGEQDHLTIAHLESEVVRIFDERFTGHFDAVRCKGKDCGELIVFMPTRRQKVCPVKFSEVGPDDQLFDPKKHTAHFTECPNADDMRRRR